MTALPTNDPIVVLAMAHRIAQDGLRPNDDAVRAAGEAAASVSTLPADVVRAGVQSVLLGPHLDRGLQWLHEVGALAQLIPELDATVDFSQEGDRRHKDVWEHTKMVVAQTPPEPILRWSALLHDVGKIKTRAFHPDGSVTFYGHAEVGARMFDGISRRLAFEREDRRRIRFLILMHLRASAYSDDWTDAAVRRLDREVGEALEDLLILSAADVTSRRPGRKQEAARNLERLRARILSIRELDARVPPLPAGLGNAIMEAFALPPSKRIGDLRALCERAIEDGRLEERREAGYYIDFLRTDPAALALTSAARP